MSGTTEERMWQDPANWRGPRWFPVYACGRDQRLLVPKQNPATGWTLNFAHGASWRALFGMMTIPSIIVLLIIWFAVRPTSLQAFVLILVGVLPAFGIMALCRWALSVPRQY